MMRARPRRPGGFERRGRNLLLLLILGALGSLGWALNSLAEEPSGAEAGAGAGAKGEVKTEAKAEEPAEAPPEENLARRLFMTAGILDRYVGIGADSIQAWQARHRADSADRSRLFQSIRQALALHDRLEEQIAQTYPRDQLEWLLITDSISDTLCESLRPLLENYARKNPEEILTQGRQFFELAMSKISGPPTRMLGLHVVLLADYAYVQADSVLASGLTTDRAGVEEGVLRNLRDWCELYRQFHHDALSIYESRLSQEDWIMSRIKDKCGGNDWRLVDQYMAMIGIDSTKTPPEERYAHEFHLKSKNCDDSRVIYVDLPNFHDVQLEVMRMQQENQKSGSEGTPPEAR